MRRAADRKRILFVSLKKEAEPLLSELRAAGHQVSIVQDIDDAHALLASRAFDQTVISGQTLGPLLDQRSLWEHNGIDAWRRSTVAIAHDLHNLLHALERCTENLQEVEAPGRVGRAEVLDLRRTMAALSTFLQELTDEFDGAAAAVLPRQVVDLEDAVEAAAMVVYSSASERRQRLIIDIEEAARHVRAEPAKVKRVLSNLLHHASRQSPSLGTVTVRARREAEGCVISITYAAETASVSGLSELFSPSETRERAGGGFYRVQNIVEQHGGRLWLESQRGAGTSIFVSLPDVIQSESTLALTPG